MIQFELKLLIKPTQNLIGSVVVEFRRFQILAGLSKYTRPVSQKANFAIMSLDLFYSFSSIIRIKRVSYILYYMY